MELNMINFILVVAFIAVVMSEETTTVDSTSIDMCEDNSTCSPIFTTSEEPAILQNITELPQLFKSPETALNTTTNICICDLQVSYCDLHCCCDPDCTYEEKQIFDHCEEDFHYYDTKFCDFNKFTYINKTLHEESVSQKGLFCVAHSSISPHVIIQNQKTIKSAKEANINKYKFSWPDQEDFQVHFDNKSYVYGKPIWIIRNNTIENLEIESNFVHSYCLIKEKIKFLNNDFKSSCFRSTLEGFNFNLYSYFDNISIITNPQIFNSSKYLKNGIFGDCPRNVCLSIEPSLCISDSCQKFPKNFRSFCTSKNNSLECVNLGKSFVYKFYHSGVKGLNKVRLEIFVTNETFTQGFKFVQNFEVIFLWINRTLNFSSVLSGNPGYLIKKPILIASLASQNFVKNGTKYQRNVIVRSPLDYRENFLTLPDVTPQGVCIHSPNTFVPSEFGYDMYTKCVIQERFLLNQTTSVGPSCISLQKRIFQLWSLNATNNTLSNLLIGKFGNARTSVSSDWLQVLFARDLHEILSNISARIDRKASILTCLNIATTLSLEFFYYRYNFETVLHQNQILAAHFQFKNFVNLSVPVLGKSVDFKVPIKSQIVFFDVTAKKVRKVFDPPSLSIKLPHDFFYPFVKLHNSGTQYFLNNHIIFCFVLIIIVF